MKKRRSALKFIVPIVSMGDIAFLLIIFFMLCSNFAREAGIKVEPPLSTDIDNVEQSRHTVLIDEDSTIYLGGIEVYSVDALETELAEQLRDAPNPDARRVLFRCDRGVDRAIFEPVLDAITRAGGTVIAIGEKAGDKPKR